METNYYDYNARDSRNIAKMKYNSGLPVKGSASTLKVQWKKRTPIDHILIRFLEYREEILDEVIHYLVMMEIGKLKPPSRRNFS